MEHGGVKISLESLGMTLSSVLPKFILNKEEAGPAKKIAPESLQRSFVFVSDIDDEDSGSIVVLGKSSLDDIQNQSLASFERIKQKSMAMDCKSIISSLTPPEVQQKLTEMLQENLRLKETLEQNNISMKEHLSMLVTRQDELGKVHEAHRLKFAETKNLVNLLKMENNELKTKVESQEKENGELKTTIESQANESNELKAKIVSQEKENDELKTKIDSQEKESTEFKTMIANREKVNIEQSTQTEKEKLSAKPNISVQSLENAQSTEMMNLAEKCASQTQEIAYMNQLITSLKQQLVSLYQDPFTSIKLEDLQSSSQQSSDSYRQQFLTSFTHYNEKLQTLGKCYAAQTSRYTSIQECLQRCSEILTDKHNAPSAVEETRQSMESEKRKELQTHRGRLIDEELKTIAERQEMIKAQNEFQKIFTDYNSALLQLESLRKENERLPTLQKGASLHDTRLEEAMASLRESERLLDEQRRGVEIERIQLAEQMQSIKRESARFQEEQRKFQESAAAYAEANLSFQREVNSIRESNEILREQLKVYENEHDEEVTLRKALLLERSDLIEHLEKLEEEKSRYMDGFQMLGGHHD